MGCSYDERQFSQLSIDQLMNKKKKIIEEMSDYYKRPTERVKRQMEIIDRQMRQELSNLKSKIEYTNGEEETESSEKSFYIRKRDEFVNLALKWEELSGGNDISCNNSLDLDSFNENGSYGSVSDDIKLNCPSLNDSEEDSSKFARELSESVCSD